MTTTDDTDFTGAEANRSGRGASGETPALPWRIDGSVYWSQKSGVSDPPHSKSWRRGNSPGRRPALDLAGSVRFGPPGTAWDRLGPHKIFSPRRKMSSKPEVQGLKPSIEKVRLSAESRYALSVTQVVDISSRMAKSCVATDWFSAPCGENICFSTHLSPLSRLIYRQLGRFCLIFLQAGPAPIMGMKIGIKIKITNKIKKQTLEAASDTIGRKTRVEWSNPSDNAA